MHFKFRSSMIVCFAVVMLFFATTFSPPSCFAQGRSRISGFVFSADGKPIENVYVELLSDVYSVISQTRTDNSGKYVFAGLRQEVYKIRVLPLGTQYTEQVKEVNLINPYNTSLGEVAQVDFHLRLDNRNSANNISSVGGVVFVQDVPENAKKKYEDAITKLEKQNSNEGIMKLIEAIELFPSYFLALDRLGAEYVKLGKPTEAIVVLTKSLEVNPRSVSSLYSIGVAYNQLKRLNESIEALQKAVSLDPESINANLWLGVSLRHAEKLEQAEKYFKQTKELCKKKKETVAELHWQLALLYNKLNKYSQAADELETFLKIQPDSRDAELIKKLIKQLREKSR